MTTNTEVKDNVKALAQEREEFKTKMVEHVARVSKERPDAESLGKGEWWMPAIDLAFDVKGKLPAETNDKINACLRLIIDGKFAPEVVGPALDEARGYLAGCEDLLVQFNKIFGNPNFWDTMYKHELEKEMKRPTDEMKEDAKKQ